MQTTEVDETPVRYCLECRQERGHTLLVADAYGASYECLICRAKCVELTLSGMTIYFPKPESTGP